MGAVADFTKAEEAHVRGALNFLRRRCGTWGTLGQAVRLSATSLCMIARGHRAVPAVLVVRLARLAGVGVDDMLAGNFPAPGTCPYCGHRKEEDP